MSIKQRRLQMGWSQEHLAQVTGLSTRTVQRIEAGRKPGLDSLKALAAVFETDTATLIREYAMTTTPENQPETPDTNEASAPQPEKQPEPRQHDQSHQGADASNLEGSPYNAAEEQVENYVTNIFIIKLNAIVFCIVIPAFYLLNMAISPGYLWVAWIAGLWLFAILLQAILIKLIFGVFDLKWERRVADEYRQRMRQ